MTASCSEVGIRYHQRRADGLPAVQALQQAQLWLARLTIDDTLAYLDELAGLLAAAGEPTDVVLQRRDELEEAARELGIERPFAHPKFWGAFSITGV